ncbi:ABC transporter ATP-binding protein [Sandaracinus amylolyticus]|uniref:ABC transporter ATP-binding protein n=1 Tax=Sandaracinus amylolyticus TaxID=927083 RepID=UPI001F15DDCE|nr:ABC transporter ATP-binding protein [Sandaracinus amylolyticus]
MPWRFASALTLFLIFDGSLTLYQYLVGRAIQDVETGRAVVRLESGALDASVAIEWTLILLGLAAARSIVQYAAGVVSLITGQELLSRLRESILAQVQRLDAKYHLRHGVGEMVARTTRDADKVRDALISFWRNVIETGLVIAASLALLAFYHPLLALVPALTLFAGVRIFFRQADTLVALDRATGDAYDAVSQDLLEGVGGVRVIKAFGLEGSRIERFDGAVSTFADHAIRAVRYATSRVAIPQLLVAAGQLWVMSVGASLVASGRLHVGELVAALLAMNTLVFRFEGIGRIIQIFADARSSAARIMELLDADTEIASGDEVLPEGPLGVRLRGVAIAGRDDDAAPILRECDLEIAPGEIVAIVGATGAGKTTLVSLLPRLLDADQGEVEIGSDARGWSRARELDLAHLRRRVRVASQESFLFSDTVEANLRLGAPDASDEDVRRALRLACADEIVDGLPEGLGTILGERGVTLSGGQRQRLALARALIADPSILVLDDSTSALDAITEQTILRHIRELGARSGGRAITLIVVASKPSTVRFADRAVVLANGTIDAQGTHHELLRTSRTYRELLGIDDGR